MALDPTEIQAIVAATTSAVLAQLGRSPAAARKAIADDERPKIAAFMAGAYPRSQGWGEPRIHAFAVELEGPRTIPNTDPPSRVIQLHHIPAEAIRGAMAEIEAKTQQPLSRTNDLRDRKAS